MQRCDICTHPAREAIDGKLRRGVSVAIVADQYAVNPDKLRRHREQHIGSNMRLVSVVTTSKQPTVVNVRMDPTALFEEHNACIAEARELIEFCKNGEGKGDTRGWALGVREWRGCLDQQNRMLGLYDNVNPHLHHAFAARLIDVVTRALEAHPEARQQVLQAIEEVEKGND